MNFSAVLLAGGESRRMGKDKATLTFHGRPLWQRQLQVLWELNPEKIFVSARIRPSWLPVETELLLDDPPSRGPLSGLTIALARMVTTHLIVLAVDMPFLTSVEFRILCGLAIAGRGVVPVIAERAEPLVAIYPREALPDFVGALGGNNFSLQALTRDLAVACKVRLLDVPSETRRSYRSVNEPDDLALEA